MIKMQKKCPVVFLAVLLSLASCAFGQQMNFKTFSSREGLTTYNISNTTQDKYGFIWIATQDGLFRFNGTSFQSFRSNKETQPSLLGNVFLHVAFDNNDAVYGSDYMYGIDIIHTSSLSVTNLGKDSLKTLGLPDRWIWDIYFDSEQTTWLRGISYFAFKRKNERRFTVVSTLEDHPEAFTPSFIRPLGKDHMAIGITGFGTLIYDKRSLQMSGIMRNVTPFSAGVQDIKDITIAGDTVILATDNSIITGSYKNDRWHFGRQFRHPVLENTVINSIVSDRHGNIWTGTGNGLVKLRPADSAFTRYEMTPGKTRWLADNTIRHLMIDRQDNLWISTSSVLQMVNISGNGFTAFDGTGTGSDPIDHIYTLAEKNEQEIFATGTNGLYEVNVQTGLSKKIPGSEALGYVHHIERITADIWALSTDYGMCAYSPATKKISRELFLELYPEWNPFKKNYFNTAFRVNDTWYWASEEMEGLLKWEKNAHRITQFKAGTANARGLPENHVRNIRSDREGYLWILSDETASRFDTKKDSVIQIIRHSPQTFRSSIIYDVYDDGQTLWFATYGGGINGLKKKDGKWTYITEAEGLTNNAVYGILPENDSILWATTNIGLTRINTRTLKCTGYFYEDGLQDNFFDEKGVLRSGNRLYFGGIRGFTSLDIAQFHATEYSFPVYIHQVEYYTGSKKKLINNLSWDKVILPPGSGPVNLYLSALLFSGNNKISFSYRIPGVINDFINAPENNIISLSGLSHGSYKVEVRHRKKDGTFAEKLLVLHIYIQPKWYQTWWFKSLIALVVLAAGYALYRLRINQVRKEEMIRIQLAGDLHDDLGSTLNSIKVHSNLALMEKDNPSHLLMIKQGAQDAISGVRDIIWVLDDKKDLLGDMLARVSQFAAPLCTANKISYTVNIPDETRELKLGKEEKRNLYMIIKESINNSLKYAGGKNILLSISRPEKKLRIEIRDDGKGFDSNNSTAGYGLRNIRNRAKAVGYTASISTSPGNGVIVVVEKE